MLKSTPNNNGTQISPIPSPNTKAVLAAQKQRSVKAKQDLERQLDVAKRRSAASEQEELANLRLEEQAASKDLLAIKQAYPRSPEDTQRSYQAEKQLEEIQRKYQFKYSDVRERYETAFRERQSDLNKAYEAELTAIESGVEPAQPISQIRRAVPVAKAIQVTSPTPAVVQDATPAEPLYSVTGVAPGDTLSVRSGPGANYNIVARLPNGYHGLRIIGSSVMNGSTEWVQINSNSYKGWVTKAYLQSE